MEHTSSPGKAFKRAVYGSDAERVRRLLEEHPELLVRINEPLPEEGFGAQALFAAVQRGDRATIEVLLGAGADIGRRTDWWAGGFGVLDECDPELVDFLMAHGAVLDAHAAARLGKVKELRGLLAGNPQLVHAPGGDGQTPLHFASTVEVAEVLLEYGAEIDARDLDHESTPAQYMLGGAQKRHYPRDRQDVARHLVARGCGTDILMASSLGDMDLVRRHLDEDPHCIRMSVNEEWFPKRNPRAGGTIYLWTLGARRTAHTVARAFGHEAVFDLLMERTPDDMKLALACELGDEAAFGMFLAQHPDATANLSESELRKLPDAAESNNTQAVRLMLLAGWPVDTRGTAGATALHWASFHGNAEMAGVILEHGPALELESRQYAGTALSWAVFGSGNGWHRRTGDYAGTVHALLRAGATPPVHLADLEPSAAVLAMLS